jgi:hypothetical protein
MKRAPYSTKASHILLIVIFTTFAIPLFLSAQTNSPYIANQEYPGFSSSHGYENPFTSSNIIYKNDIGNYRITPILKVYVEHSQLWFLVVSEKSPSFVWVSGGPTYFLNKDAFEKIPTFKNLPGINYPSPGSFPGNKYIDGIATPNHPAFDGKNIFDNTIFAYSSPLENHTILHHIKGGTRVKGLATISDKSYVLVKIAGIKDLVWVDSMSIKWKGVDWYLIRDDQLTLLQPEFEKPIEYPAIVKPTEYPLQQNPASSLPSNSTFILHDTLNELHSWDGNFPKKLKPQGDEKASVNIIIRKDPVLVKVTQYFPYGNYISIRLDFDIIMLDNNTGQFIASTVLRGQPPNTAPLSIKSTDSNIGVGAIPSVDELVTWVKSIMK